MSHGEGWQFIQVGRYIERAAATALLLEAYHEDLWSHSDRILEGNEYLEWMGLLRCATAFEAYCKVYTADVTPDRILEFLLLDEEFPHSVRFSINTLRDALEAIHGEGGKSRAEPLRQLVGRLQSSLGYSSVEGILNGDVVAYLRGIRYQCRTIPRMIISFTSTTAFRRRWRIRSSMYYSIRHLTSFSTPVSESMMETRHPRSDHDQRCLTFHLSVSPRCRVFSYRDHLANHVHHFDIPGQHGQLVIVAESLVEVAPSPAVPAFLAPDAWDELDSMIEQGDYWEMLLPSEFATATPSLDALAEELRTVRRRDDPLMVLHQINEQMFNHFEYVPRSTKEWTRRSTWRC